MKIQVTDGRLSEAQAWSEIKAQIADGTEGKPNVGGFIVYEISDACAATIANGFSGSALTKLANGEPVGPEYVHDDIDNLLDSETDEWNRQALSVLKGWTYKQVMDAPREPMEQVPEDEQLKIASISVRDLLGRYVANRHGREFKITDIRYNLKWDKVTFELSDLDEDGEVVPDSESGIFSLKGWELL
jgi:hypothetical protein